MVHVRDRPLLTQLRHLTRPFKRAAKLDDNKPSTWRVTYGEVPGLTNEQIRERLPAKFATILPGAPKDRLQYEVKNFAPYKVHQRIVDRMTVGRVSLAGDSAHLNSPFGGLGLTSESLLSFMMCLQWGLIFALLDGMIDAGKLADCYYGILRGMATPAILEKYSVIVRPNSLGDRLQLMPHSFGHIYIETQDMG